MADATADSSSEADLPSSAQVGKDEFHSFSENEDNVSMSDDALDKDEAELELEKLVFGDDDGFKETLKRERTDQVDTNLSFNQTSEDPGSGLGDVADSDLFFLDSGPNDLLPKPIRGLSTNRTREAQEPVAWEDSEDERMMVSLMSVPRLRKLRHYEDEDAITGREYTHRLRQQFEYLNPRPEWANWNSQSISGEKRRLLASEDASSDDDMALSDTEMTTQPLATLLRSSESLVRAAQILPNKRRKLQPEVISVERMKDIEPKQASAITCLSIHPSLPLILSSGPSSTLYLHSLLPHPVPPDPPNPLITSLHLKSTPLSTTAFSSPSGPSPISGPKVYMSARRRYFHVWDLPSGAIEKITRIYGHSEEQRSMEILKPSPCGRYVALKGSSRKGSGVVNILSAETLQWVSQVRVESRNGIADFAWWRDGRGMVLVGRGGEVSEWNVETEEIVARWQDEGAVATTVLALGGEISQKGKPGSSPAPKLGSDRWIAIGSSVGIVNVYDRSAWHAGSHSSKSQSDATPPPHPKPTKTLENLVTSISHLAFSPCGQLLAMASRGKRDALRLVHLPSCTPYRNWPTAKTPLGRISALAFGEYEDAPGDESSARNLVLAIGNEAGALRAWELGQ